MTSLWIRPIKGALHVLIKHLHIWQSEAAELYAIIFDVVYGSLILSSPLYTLDTIDFYT